MIKLKKKQYLWLSWLSCLSLSVLPLTICPVLSAERIYVSYSLFERSIPVKDLEIYAQEGRLTPNLAAYTRYLNKQQLANLRVGLQAQINLDPVTISQFLYTPIGERLLQRVGQVVQTDARQSGFYAIRAALILAAASPRGLTALSVLRNFPSQGIRVDLAKGLGILQSVQEFIAQTNAAVVAVQNQSQPADNTHPELNAFQVKALQFPGPLAWEKITLQLNDQTPRRLELTGAPRAFLADIYLPKLVSVRPSPVIVISHGLGSDRMSFAYLAQHLASYGFVVAVPEHPGSSSQQLQALLSGGSNDVTKPTEFVDRPLDIKFLLDELNRRSQSDLVFQGRLNLEQVGAIGQSFGGYTVLALAGAQINFEQLQKDCGTNLDRTLNASLLLQCRALALPARNYDLTDPRVKAAIAVNPIDSSVFGQPGLRQIKIPVMLVSGSADTVAPALPEQIQPFTWLTTPEKYLVVLDGGTHFSTIAESNPESKVIPVPPALIGPATGLARNYLNALSLAFFRTYTANQSSYTRYLTPASIKLISQEPLNLSLNQTLSAAQLVQALRGKPANLPPTTAPEAQPFPGASINRQK